MRIVGRQRGRRFCRTWNDVVFHVARAFSEPPSDTGPKALRSLISSRPSM